MAEEWLELYWDDSFYNDHFYVLLADYTWDGLICHYPVAVSIGGGNNTYWYAQRTKRLNRNGEWADPYPYNYGPESLAYDTSGRYVWYNVPCFNDESEAKKYAQGLSYDATKIIRGEPYVPPIISIIVNGGGATHIAKVTGQLKDLSSNLSDILIVSGGGGGGLIIGEDVYNGADAGGISGNGNNSADQSAGYTFGQGESGSGVSGGGAGLYGGYKGTEVDGGGAGSGWIANAKLHNKKMVGYNVPTSDAEATKTESVQVVSSIAEANKPKSGNGFARITFLRPAESDWMTAFDGAATEYINGTGYHFR